MPDPERSERAICQRKRVAPIERPSRCSSMGRDHPTAERRRLVVCWRKTTRRTRRPVRSSVAVAQTRSDLNIDGRVADRLVVTLQVEHHPVDAGAEDVLDGEAALDL